MYNRFSYFVFVAEIRTAAQRMAYHRQYFP